jgi:GTP-binding protein
MPLVAIVGRPNVGKSTIFNRLTEERRSIVHDEPGVTRDRVYGEVVWGGRSFSIVDTGGFVTHSEDRFEAAIREQVRLAIDEADLILFVNDVTVGITDLDQEMANMLRKSDRPVLVVGNKADNEERRWDANTLYQLGFDDVYAISAVNGMGTGDLLDAVNTYLPEGGEGEEDDRPRFAIIGRPNVGKSSLTNVLLGEERSIVTEISGTTRDSVDAVMKVDGREIVLVDTAGLRRKAKVRENVEFYSTLRTERAMESCTTAILLIDAVEGLESQDIRVLKQAETMKKGLVLGINKWDLVNKETNSARDYEAAIRERLQTLDFIPIVTISAMTKQRVRKLLDKVLAVDAERHKRITTSKLNDWLKGALARHNPPMYRNQRIKINYVTQVRSAPPVFQFFTNQPKGVREGYRRYLENRLREAYGFEGVPIKMVFKQK